MRWIFVRFAVFSCYFFSPHSPDFLQKETASHGFEPLASCLSATSYSNAPSVTYFNNISCELKISVKISGENFKVWHLSGEKFSSPHAAVSGEKILYCFLLVALKIFFSLHSTGSGEKFSFTAQAVKRKFSPINSFFSPHLSHSAQILHFLLKFNANLTSLALFSNDTSTRVVPLSDSLHIYINNRRASAITIGVASRKKANEVSMYAIEI